MLLAGVPAVRDEMTPAAAEPDAANTNGRSEMVQTRTEAVEVVLSVLRHGGRSDRYLRVTDAGVFFTTPDRTFLTADGPETPPFVTIPVASGTSEYEEEQWAEMLLSELESKIEEANDETND